MKRKVRPCYHDKLHQRRGRPLALEIQLLSNSYVSIPEEKQLYKNNVF